MNGTVLKAAHSRHHHTLSILIHAWQKGITKVHTHTQTLGGRRFLGEMHEFERDKEYFV